MQSAQQVPNLGPQYAGSLIVSEDVFNKMQIQLSSVEKMQKQIEELNQKSVESDRRVEICQSVALSSLQKSELLEQQNSLLKEELEKLKSQNQILLTDYQSIRLERSSLSLEYQELKEKYVVVEESLKKMLADLKSYEEKCLVLEEDKEEILRINQGLKDNNEALTNDLEKVRATVRTCLKDLVSHELRHQTLLKDKVDLQESLQIEQQRVSLLAQENSEKDDEIDTLNDQLSQKDERIEELAEERDAVLTALVKVQKQSAEGDQKIARLSQELANKVQQLDLFKLELEKLKKQQAELMERNNALEDENADLFEELETINQELRLYGGTSERLGDLNNHFELLNTLDFSDLSALQAWFVKLGELRNFTPNQTKIISNNIEKIQEQLRHRKSFLSDLRFTLSDLKLVISRAL